MYVCTFVAVCRVWLVSVCASVCVVDVAYVSVATFVFARGLFGFSVCLWFSLCISVFVDVSDAVLVCESLCLRHCI